MKLFPIPCCFNGISGGGNPHADVLIMGIAPGRDEAERTHTPFTGPAGKLLDSLLDTVGYSRDLCAFTNFHCQWNDKPSPEEFAVCRNRVIAEIHAVSPKLIITLGELPCEQIYGPKQLGKHRGVPIWSAEYNCYIMPTYHPAGVLRGNTYLVHDIIRDLAKIHDIITWPTNHRNANFKYEVIGTKLHAQSILDSVAALPLSTRVSIDIEANPKSDVSDIWMDPLLCLAITWDGVTAYVIPQQFCRDLNWPMHRRWVYSYGPYDTQGILKYLDIKLDLAEDIVLQSYSVDERTPRAQEGGRNAAGGPVKGIHGLKQQAAEYEGAAFYNEVVKASWKSGTFDYPTLYKYNAADTIYTWRRSTKLEQVQRDDGVWDLYHNLLIPAQASISEQTYAGIPIDLSQTREFLQDWSKLADELEEEVIQTANELGWPGRINLASPKQMSNFIYGTLGLRSDKQPSVDAEAIEQLTENYPDVTFFDPLIMNRKLRKVIDTYLLGIIDDIKIDGAIHPHVLLHGTVTGRTSYTDPPVQTIPKPYTYEPYEARFGFNLAMLRKIFYAPKGYVIVEADYNQIEMWMMAFQSNCSNMLEDLRRGDLHRYTAARILDKNVQDVTDHEKTYQGKKVNFGIGFDVGPATLANKHTGIGCTIQEAARYKSLWHQNYPEYGEWTREVIRKANLEGELVCSPTGRKRRFKLDVDNYGRRQAVNAMMQSPAGDYDLTSMIELHNHPTIRANGRVLMMCHDSINFLLRADTLDQTLPVIASVMESERLPGFPIVNTDISVGTNLWEQQIIRKGGRWK